MNDSCLSTHSHTHIYIYIYIDIRGSLNKFPDFFVLAILLIVHTSKSIPLEVISSGCNAFVVPIQQLLEDPMEVLLCERSNDLRHSLFHLFNSLLTTASELTHREQGLDYREAEKLSLCPFWSNSLWQGWSCGLVHCPAGNATDPIWRVLASFDSISFWTPLTPQHNIPCWMSIQWQPSACRSFKKEIIKSLWVDLLCLAILGVGQPACFHWELCLLVSKS